MEQHELTGFVTPGDQKVPVSVRDWNAMKLALWRSRGGWEIAEREANELLDRCTHSGGCPGTESETEPCLSTCSNRELRMSALVILNAARMFAPIDARRPANDPYLAPSREYFSEILAELAIAQTDLGVLRTALRTAGIQVPSLTKPLEETIK